jgi:hypothetical protein
MLPLGEPVRLFEYRGIPDPWHTSPWDEYPDDRDAIPWPRSPRAGGFGPGAW